jgi:hypothetical protein
MIIKILSACALLAILGPGLYKARAQEISGFSTVSVRRISTGGQSVPVLGGITGGQSVPAVQGGSRLVVASYLDTEEDYTASLYYNVESDSSLFEGGGSTALGSGGFVGNPKAFGTYYVNYPGAGLFTEVTNHVVDFFYVAADGAYADPYGFSTEGDDGDYNSGYWFSVYSNLYVVEASVVLGQSYDSTNSQVYNYGGPEAVTVLYQNFIPTDYAPGPPPIMQTLCYPDIYLGDNRTFNPALGSYRAFQAVSAGVGGLTTINSSTAPPIQATGFTYEFSQSVLQNNVVPDTAFNYDYLYKCSSLGVNEYGQASTSTMVLPTVTYNGPNSTTTELKGDASNPIPTVSFAISWDANVTLTEPSTYDLHVAGTFVSDCFPSHELSVAQTDVIEYPAPSNASGSTIGLCLAGVGQVNKTINYDIPLQACCSH